MSKSEFDDRKRLAFHRNPLDQVQPSWWHGDCRAIADAGYVEIRAASPLLDRHCAGGRERSSPQLSVARTLTWADRTGAGFTGFFKFNLTAGLFSIAGNLLLMKLLVRVGQMNYLLANGITITACSVVNFLVSDGLVFAATTPRTSLARQHLTIDVMNDTH
jgi:GtrA-like protein